MSLLLPWKSRIMYFAVAPASALNISNVPDPPPSAPPPLRVMITVSTTSEGRRGHARSRRMWSAAALVRLMPSVVASLPLTVRSMYLEVEIRRRRRPLTGGSWSEAMISNTPVGVNLTIRRVCGQRVGGTAADRDCLSAPPVSSKAT